MKYNSARVTISDRTVLVKYRDRVFTSVYPMSVEAMPVHHVDVMIWLLLWGHGVSPVVNGMEVPEYFAVGADHSRPNTGKSLLCYSAGADSTAAMAIYPSTGAIIRRIYDRLYNATQVAMADAMGVLVIDSDFELARMLLGKSHGFNIGCGYVPSPPLYL